jgi:hypothetical protein
MSMKQCYAFWNPVTKPDFFKSISDVPWRGGGRNHYDTGVFTTEDATLRAPNPLRVVLALWGERVVCMKDIYFERNMGERQNIYFSRHFAWLKYFTYRLVPVLAVALVV